MGRAEDTLAAERDGNNTELINLPYGECTEGRLPGVLAGQPEAALDYAYEVGRI